ncbi:MAG: DNA-dependent RNA polymerase auxiliary subunit epsilon family protein [Lactobacillales bacterium]|jgi:DNA-dependent RNA polymerase auxiliary subunit epsilon|nr:DNA-dependent RNA polymerase auxiliary subunit epsilon family protein [Lactobacillales bacterium]
MIFKVYYQEDKIRNPRREKTKSLYIKAGSKVDVIKRVEKNTPYNIEYIIVLEGKHLNYEKQYADFKLVEY